MRRVTPILAVTLLLAAGAVVPARSQVATSIEAGMLVAASEYDVFSTPQLGFRIATVKPRSVGVDFSLATLPVGIRQGLIVAMPDLDLGFAIPAGDRTAIVPRIGASAIVGFSSEGGGAAAGYNVGIGLITQVSQKTAIRIDYTYRRLLGGEGGLPLSSLSLGVAWTR